MSFLTGKRLVYISVLMSSFAFANHANAMPFSPDPISFAGWLNQQNGKSFWYDRSMIVKFEHLGNCEYSFAYGSENYSCKVGYATIKDNIRNQKCRVYVEYTGGKVNLRDYECRNLAIKEVSKPWIDKVKTWFQ
jgi:hypothetical protein